MCKEFERLRFGSPKLGSWDILILFFYSDRCFVNSSLDCVKNLVEEEFVELLLFVFFGLVEFNESEALWEF